MLLSRQLCSAVALLALFLAPASGPRGIASAPVAFDIPGRADATPWIAASGSFVAVTWGATAEGKTDVFAAVSRDGGVTFAAPVQVNTVSGEARLGGEQPARVALVRTRGATIPEVVVLWTARAEQTAIKVARSRDGGRTFSAPVVLQASDAAGARGWPAVALDPRGKVHAIWLDHRDMAAKPAAGAPSHTPGAAHDGVAMAQKSGLYYASVTNGTAREHRITRSVCYCCKTALAAGTDGTLYAAWRHVYPGDLRDMAFTMSRDAGRTFSPIVRVAEDHWAVNACPDDGPALALDSRNDARNVVHAVWPTVTEGANAQGAIFYASTADGRRFSPRIRIPTLGGPKPTHPQVVVDRSGRVIVAWDETVNGRRVSAAREIRVKGSAVPEFGEIVTIPANGPTAYPMLAATDTGLVAIWTTVGEPSRVELQPLVIR